MKSRYEKDQQVQASSGGQAESASRSAGSLLSEPQQTPRTVIRGESLSSTPIPRPESEPFAAITDWLNCTFPLPETRTDIRGFLNRLVEVAGRDFIPMTEIGKGLNGWRRSFKLGESSAKFGIGGQRGRAFLSMSGDACNRIPNYVWPTFIELIRDGYRGRITRWDGAVDDYEGIHSVDWAIEQYEAGGFNAGGNKPKCKQHGNFICPDGSGRTVEFGRRKNGKMIRIYEKGKQLGDPNSDWIRWEVELHNKRRDIPWDVLLHPGDYVTGAYKCTSWVSEKMSRIATHQKTQAISEEVLVACAKQSYGQLLDYLLNKHKDPGVVLELLRRHGVPTRLSQPEPAD